MSEFNWAKQAEQLWDDKSEFWTARSKEMWETGSRKDIVSFFQTYVNSGAKVADLGCGDGYGSYKLSQSGYEVTGVDVSDDMVHKATQLNASNSARFIKGDISKLTFADDELDAVMAINSLEWTESPLTILREMKRVVKSNGKACIAILGPTAAPRVNSFERLYGEKVVCNTMMPWEFERLATENGWEKEAEFGVYKKETESLSKGALSVQMQQALTFMWVFMLKNKK